MSNLNARDHSVNCNNDDDDESTSKARQEVDDEGNSNQKSEILDKISMIVAEVIGTGLLLFFGCMGCIDWIGMPGLPISSAINFGLTVMFIIQIFGHVSFAIINPAVVIVAVVHRYISIKMGILFVIAEVIGATLGYGLLLALTPSKFSNPEIGLCTTVPHESITTIQAFFIEFCLTFTLILIISGVWDPRNRDNGDSIPLRIGFAVIALSLAGGTSTGASMNPARTFGPAIWNGEWRSHWIYWVAPLSASLLSSIFYRTVFHRPNPMDLIKRSTINKNDQNNNGMEKNSKNN